MFQNIFSNSSLNLLNYCHREAPKTKLRVTRNSEASLGVFPFSNRLKEQNPGRYHMNDAQRRNRVNLYRITGEMKEVGNHPLSSFLKSSLFTSQVLFVQNPRTGTYGAILPLAGCLPDDHKYKPPEQGVAKPPSGSPDWKGQKKRAPLSL